MSNGYMRCRICKTEFESEEWWHCPKCGKDGSLIHKTVSPEDLRVREFPG